MDIFKVGYHEKPRTRVKCSKVYECTESNDGLEAAYSGAACNAGFVRLPVFPLCRLSIAPRTHRATSLSAVGGASCSLSFKSSAASSLSSDIVGGLSRGASQTCRSSSAYVGLSFGVLFKQPRTKSLAASEKPSMGRLGGSPSTMAYDCQ